MSLELQPLDEVNEINVGFNSSIFQSGSLFVRECISPDKKNNNNLSNCL